MDSPPLSRLYDHIVQAPVHGDAASAHAAFLTLVGLGSRRSIREVPTVLPDRAVPMLRYFRPRLVDKYALLEGTRRVAKFEDLTAPAADAFQAELQGRGLRTVRTGPYAKRFDVTVAGAIGAGQLFNVIASHGNEADVVAEAERDRTPAGTRRAGLALGYPPCCVEHFVETEGSPRAVREGVNEAAIRSPRGQGQDAPWELNLLSSMTPVGFVPCSTTCPEAMSFAWRVLEAVREADPAGRALVETVLRRPILFFRYPVFYVFDGVAVDRRGVRGVRYRTVAPNDDGTGSGPALHAFAHDEIGAVLEQGDEVTLGNHALEIRQQGNVLAHWDIADPDVPMLMRFTG